MRFKLGFTLVELMIALALFILFLLMILFSFKVLKTQSEDMARVSVLETVAEEVLNILEKELSQAKPVEDLNYAVIAPNIAESTTYGAHSRICLFPLDINNEGDLFADDVSGLIYSFDHQTEDYYFRNVDVGDQPLIPDNCTPQVLAFTTDSPDSPAILKLLYLQRDENDHSLALMETSVIPTIGLSLTGESGISKPIQKHLVVTPNGVVFVLYTLATQAVSPPSYNFQTRKVYSFPPEVLSAAIFLGFTQEVGNEAIIAHLLNASTGTLYFGDPLYMPNAMEVRIALISYPYPFKRSNPPAGGESAILNGFKNFQGGSRDPLGKRVKTISIRRVIGSLPYK